MPEEEATQDAPVVALQNFRFVPEVLEVRAGERARFTVTSGGAAHTFTIPALGVDVTLPAGITETVEFDVPDGEKGDMSLICRFHSNAGSGMVAKIRVSNGGGDGGYSY